jgi:hypothetical protein
MVQQPMVQQPMVQQPMVQQPMVHQPMVQPMAQPMMQLPVQKQPMMAAAPRVVDEVVPIHTTRVEPYPVPVPVVPPPRPHFLARVRLPKRPQSYDFPYHSPLEGCFFDDHAKHVDAERQKIDRGHASSLWAEPEMGHIYDQKGQDMNSDFFQHPYEHVWDEGHNVSRLTHHVGRTPLQSGVSSGAGAPPAMASAAPLSGYQSGVQMSGYQSGVLVPNQSGVLTSGYGDQHSLLANPTVSNLIGAQAPGYPSAYQGAVLTSGYADQHSFLANPTVSNLMGAQAQPLSSPPQNDRFWHGWR